MGSVTVDCNIVVYLLKVRLGGFKMNDDVMLHISVSKTNDSVQIIIMREIFIQVGYMCCRSQCLQKTAIKRTMKDTTEAICASRKK